MSETTPDSIPMIEGSPHVHARFSTASVMYYVALALLPASFWGVIVFGWNALIVLVVSIASALLGEFLVNLCAYLIGRNTHPRRSLSDRVTLWDGSALVTGLLIGMNLSPLVPLYIPVVASLFAILVVKMSFGGLGANWMNPALAGRAFVFFCFARQMAVWRDATQPGLRNMFDTTTGATPLGALKGALISGASGDSPLAVINSAGESYGYLDLFLGRTGGCTGEVSALLILLGAVVLLIRRVITWPVPVAYLGSFSVLVLLFGGLPLGAGLMTGDVVFHLLSGGVVLGACFMATDMVTCPLTVRGQLIFGVGCGVINFLIRIYGSYPEGTMLAILFMNITVPLIDRLVTPRRYGVDIKEEAPDKA